MEQHKCIHTQASSLSLDESSCARKEIKWQAGGKEKRGGGMRPSIKMVGGCCPLLLDSSRPARCCSFWVGLAYNRSPLGRWRLTSLYSHLYYLSNLFAFRRRPPPLFSISQPPLIHLGCFTTVSVRLMMPRIDVHPPSVHTPSISLSHTRTHTTTILTHHHPGNGT